MIDAIGGRKVAALLVMMVLGIGLVVARGDVPTNFMSLMQFAFAAFIAGNAVEHSAGAYVEARVPEPAANPLNDEAVNKLLESAHATQEGVATVQATLAAILQRYQQ